ICPYAYPTGLIGASEFIISTENLPTRYSRGVDLVIDQLKHKQPPMPVPTALLVSVSVSSYSLSQLVAESKVDQALSLSARLCNALIGKGNERARQVAVLAAQSRLNLMANRFAEAYAQSLKALNLVFDPPVVVLDEDNFILLVNTMHESARPLN